MTSKRQQTMAKVTRERTVREKREKKLEKKRAAAAVRKAKADGTWIEPETPEEPEEPADDSYVEPIAVS
ncbi:MAG TPA: hypothetical protein VMK83_11025 [Gaiellaceae bacterium]|nr:hypothetical protein [Gaiellaceae bacterium]